MNLSTRQPVTLEELLKLMQAPAEWPGDLLDGIRLTLVGSGCKVVVLDDDPTGTQTVYDMPVLTHWSVEALTSELKGNHQAFYLLTNSRSMSPSRTRLLHREIGDHLLQASRLSGVPVKVISRSDSTLRGHFPDEVDALADAMGLGGLPYLIIPCFFEGGRYTANDVHYVAEGQMLVPAAQTAYARDAAFGYGHSNLRRWIEEKTYGRISQNQVVSITLNDLREGGPNRVAEILIDLVADSACVVNAVSYRDLEVFVFGLLKAEKRGARFLFRTAASFVRIRCGLKQRDVLQPEELVTDSPNGGLFVVGSYVHKTTEQVQMLMAQEDLAAIEIETPRLLDGGEYPTEIARVTEEMNNAIGKGKDVLLFTSRKLVKGENAAESLDIGRRVSDGLIQIVKGLQHCPRYLVAKGGITSSDVATHGLGVQRAMVMGQVLPGVPVWKLGEEARFPGMAYIIFPGNVGEDDALAVVRRRLRDK